MFLKYVFYRPFKILTIILKIDNEGDSMLTTYQLHLIGYLYKKCFIAAKETKDKYGIDLFKELESVGKRIEQNYCIPSFLETWHKHTSLRVEKDPLLIIPLSKESSNILIDMIEFMKISAKKIQLSEHPYNECHTLYILINYTLPEQFNFCYYEKVKEYPYTMDIKQYLISNGLIEVEIENDKVWVDPNNFNAKEELALSSLYIEEAEGFYYIGGVNALDEVIRFVRMDIQEIEDFYEKLKGKN